MSRKQNRGFTLIEILIAMGITVILGGIGTANYFSYQSVQIIEGAASELSGTLRDVRQRAVSQDNSSAWGVYVVNTLDDTNDYYEVFYGNSRASGTVLSRTNLPAGVDFLLPPQIQNKNIAEILFAKSTGYTNADHTITIMSMRDASLLRTLQINKSTGFVSTFSGLSDAPVVDSISPNFALNIEPVNISNILGSNFQSGATVKLTKTGQADINCTAPIVDSTRLSSFTCNITNAILGVWDVVVINPDNQTGTKRLFTISTTGGNVSGFAWSDIVGWLSFSCSNDVPSSCGAVTYGVDIDPTSGLFSGYAWSENVGWISFATSTLVGCPFGTCEARVPGGFTNEPPFPKTVTGWGRVLSLQNEPNGGWIKLSTTTAPLYGVELLANGKFSGYAWEPDVVGWINFGTTTAPVYNVQATW